MDGWTADDAIITAAVAPVAVAAAAADDDDDDDDEDDDDDDDDDDEDDDDDDSLSQPVSPCSSMVVTSLSYCRVVRNNMTSCTVNIGTIRKLTEKEGR